MKIFKKLIITVMGLFTMIFIFGGNRVYGAETFENRIFYGNISLTYQGKNDINRNVFLLSFNLPRESSTVFYANGIISNYNEFVTAGDDYQLLYVVDAVNNNAFISNVNGKLDSDNYLYLGRYDIIVLEYERIFTIRNGEIAFDMTLNDIDNYYNNTSWSMYVEGLTQNQTAYDNGYDDGYNDAKEQYAYYDNGTYHDGNYAYDKGYQDGLDSDSQSAYNKGYIDGGNNAFQANLHVWIVPAIIIVIGLGGYLTIARSKRDE